MKITFLVFIFLLFLTFNLPAQKRYSFGTDYTFMPGFREEKDEWSETVLMVGLAATGEISLKSSVHLGLNYFQTKSEVGDSLNYRRRYLEMPLFLKRSFSPFERVFKLHMLAGVGANMLIGERRTSKNKSRNQSVLESYTFKPDAINFSYGLGFDIKITKAFYLSFDGLFRFYYHFADKRSVAADKWSLTPVTKGGIFVWLN